MRNRSSRNHIYRLFLPVPLGPTRDGRYGASSQKATSMAGVSVSPSVPSKSNKTAVLPLLSPLPAFMIKAEGGGE